MGLVLESVRCQFLLSFQEACNVRFLPVVVQQLVSWAEPQQQGLVDEIASLCKTHFQDSVGLHAVGSRQRVLELSLYHHL